MLMLMTIVVLVIYHVRFIYLDCFIRIRMLHHIHRVVVDHIMDKLDYLSCSDCGAKYSRFSLSSATSRHDMMQGFIYSIDNQRQLCTAPPCLPVCSFLSFVSGSRVLS